MPRRDLSYEEVLRIVELVKTTRFSEFRLKVGEIEVHLRRSNGAAPPEQEAAAAESKGAAAHGVAAAQPSAPGKERQFPPGSVLVRSPMVGTFYRAPAPDAPPFVEVGQHVEPGATVCIIEVMKLMNSIAAEARGIVAEILVANGARVEAGEVLMAIRPDPEDG
jgi:acetyl-CoA carboxylase biotin carboxyl carrier protein